MTYDSAARGPRRAPSFGILTTIDGFEVIAEDTGRPVAVRDTAMSANGTAQVLNLAARGGPEDLRRAFKRVRAGVV